MHNFFKKFSEKFRQIQFSLRINIIHGDLFDFENYEVIKQLNSTRNFFRRDPVVVLADPFLYVHKNELFLFYEKQIGINGKGIIKMKKTKDLKSWSAPRVVLREKFHLSYPNVFKIDDQIYMMPETHENKSIVLYTPNYDLTKWKYHMTLIEGKDFVDSTIIRHRKKLYLFTTEYNDTESKLRLYHTDSIAGEWKEHPKSPLKSGRNNSRCAGSLFYHDNILYRPCQRSDITYGDGVDIYEVETLSATDYKEKKSKKIIPNEDKFYAIGGHHFNPCTYKNMQLAATDALVKRMNIYEIARRIKNKFSKTKK